jgi:uncharacterized metal-binding protein YceD (DUF177 family)
MPAESTNKIKIDRLTRLKHKVEGELRPQQLARLKPFLAGDEGEIKYTVTGSETADAAGGRIARVKCIISGWFLLSDPETFEPEPYELSIESVLIPVRDEAELPPLEAENENEDYVVMGEELDIVDLVEEEILLDLPFWAIAADADSVVKPIAPKGGSRSAAAVESDNVKEPSPFAKLASLKKVH